jgi:hypothetical protein
MEMQARNCVRRSITTFTIFPGRSIFVNTLRKTINLYRNNSIIADHVPVNVRTRLFKYLELVEF